MARTIVITSGKGGVGKTTVVAHLGVQLASRGCRVVLIDVDIGLNNLDVVMGVENKVVFDIVDVIENKCRTKQALIQDFSYPTLYIMPSAHSYNTSCITTSNIKKVVQELETYFDYILIDCPAGIDLPFKRAVCCAKEAIVVVTPHISSLRDADKVISLIKASGINSINIIANRIRGDMVVDNKMISCSQISNLLDCDLVGVVPEDDQICVNSMYGIAAKDGSESATAFSIIANNIMFGENKLYDYQKKYRGVFGYIKRNIKRRV